MTDHPPQTRDYSYAAIAEAPQLAEWVLKALPVIEAARLAVSNSHTPFGDPTPASVLLPRSIFNDLRAALAALGGPVPR